MSDLPSVDIEQGGAAGGAASLATARSSISNVGVGDMMQPPMNTSRSAIPDTDRSALEGLEDPQFKLPPPVEGIDEAELESRVDRNERKRKEREARRKASHANVKFDLFKWIRSIFVTEYSIPEEQLEEYRMLSGLEPEYICRLRDYFTDEVGSEDGVMTEEMFLEIPFVELNPLRDRLALCFGYEHHPDHSVTEMDFEMFLQGVALFNSHGKREEKLKVAFKMHDFDGDGQISKSDLMLYLERVAEDRVEEVDKIDVIDEVFRESSSDSKGQFLSFQDFSRVMAPTDFHIKLVLPF